jgi:hypothetical protein
MPFGQANRGGCMRRKRRTAREKIAGVIKWARQVGCFNIAAELNDALALLPPEPERKRLSRPKGHA